MKNGIVNLKKFWIEGEAMASPSIHQYRSRKTQKFKKKGCLHIRIHNSFDVQLQNEPNYKFFE